MDTSDNSPEYEALKRRAEELRKELALDQPLDKLGILRAEVKSLEALKDMNIWLKKLEEIQKAREDRKDR